MEQTLQGFSFLGGYYVSSKDYTYIHQSLALRSRKGCSNVSLVKKIYREVKKSSDFEERGRTRTCLRPGSLEQGMNNHEWDFTVVKFCHKIIFKRG